MPTITSARRSLAAELEAAAPDLQVYAHVPETIDTDTAGTVVIEASENYLTHGETFSGRDVQVRLDLVVLVAYAGENETAADELDAALVALWQALPRSWLVTSTGKPGPQTNGEWTAYGVRLTVETITNL